MAKASSAAIRQGGKAIKDLELLKALQSEIKHELSHGDFKNSASGSMGDFVMEWDSPQSQDVVLRKKCQSGEELAVSALQAPYEFQEDGTFSKEGLMKVCIKKPALSSILQFDCRVFPKGQGGSDFDIQNAYYLKSSTSCGSSVYKGPPFRDLDLDLQDELKHYLVNRGIGESLTNFILHHLSKKEQDPPTSIYKHWFIKKMREKHFELLIKTEMMCVFGNQIFGSCNILTNSIRHKCFNCNARKVGYRTGGVT